MTNCEHDFRGLLGICDKCKKTNIIIAFEDGFEKGKAEQKFSETEEGKKVIKQICIDWGLLYKRQDSETMWKDFDVARVIRETADLAHEKGKDSEREEHDCKITEDIEKAYANGRNDEETEWRTILLAEREKGLIDKGIAIGKAEACHMHSEEHFYGCPDKECHEWMEKVVKDIEKTERNRILDEVEKLFTEWELLPHAYQELSTLRGEQKCKCCGSEFSGTYHCSPCVKKHIDDEIKNAQKELMKWFLEESVTDENQNRVIDGYTFAMKEKEVKG